MVDISNKMLFSFIFFPFVIDKTMSLAQIPTPRNVIVTSATPRTQNITWSYASAGKSDVVHFIIKGMNQFDGKWTKMTTSPTVVTSSRCMVTNLLPSNKYKYKVAAVTQKGQGQWSKRSTVASTQLEDPGKAPTGVEGKEVNSGEIALTWKPLQPKYFGSPEITYEIVMIQVSQQLADSMSNNGSDEAKDYSLSWSMGRRFNSKISSMRIQVNSTVYPVPYCVKVRAWNEMGKGPFSKPVIVYSAAVDAPAPPYGFHVDWYNAYQVKLSWKDGNERNISVTGYKICLCNLIKGCEPDLLLNMTTSSNESSIEISDLLPGNLYMVRIASYNDAGAGQWSASDWDSMDPGVLIFDTASPPPDISPTVEYIKVEGNRALVIWSPPVLVVTKVIGYYVELWLKNQTSDDAVRNETKNTEIILDLTPQSDFYMWVRAYNKGGPGRPSDIFVISTLNGTSSRFVDPNAREDGGGGDAATVCFDMVLLMTSLAFMFTIVEVLR